jgi:hypothetical protein
MHGGDAVGNGGGCDECDEKRLAILTTAARIQRSWLRCMSWQTAWWSREVAGSSRRGRARKFAFRALLKKHIGSVDPYALKIPAPKGRNTH